MLRARRVTGEADTAATVAPGAASNSGESRKGPPVTLIESLVRGPYGWHYIEELDNDLGRGGKGFVVALSKRWPEPRERFIAWHAGGEPDAPPLRPGDVGRAAEEMRAAGVTVVRSDSGSLRR